ncbi:histidinol-phosphate transaminase [Geofilum rubicundum]|uniref:Histidinol-phosphate aminotransferase n=1 Tax=Geofilum rubicundum JCM 15548 TaxID=1236989 RepID=A0A0E9LW11_9BACT|nr:histidinol-phosphate transaminase [Geofilum rubicundum]GAO29050.1 histidinol-phosphate aminotransferase [Geofilum rubicundum JCM 15548]
MKPLEQLLRPNILRLKPYSSARDEYSGEEGIFLDANENPFNAPYNRYPDPHQRKLKRVIGELKQCDPSSIFLGNGSDEAIDLVFRAFCRPGVDNVVSIDPTYGMYQVAAETNDIEVRKVLLTPDFELNTEAVLKAVDQQTKIIWLCSPNNPTGNCFHEADIKQLLTTFEGIVVLDEAYIDFAPGKSLLPQLSAYPNLVVLQTFSKAWGMAGIRLGMAFASPDIIQILSRIKYPYNLNVLTQQKAMELISKNKVATEDWIELLIAERLKMAEHLKQLPFVHHVYPSDANFLLLKTPDAKKIYNYLVERKIVIRDRSSVALCAGCLRITIGSPEENKALINQLSGLQ